MRWPRALCLSLALFWGLLAGCRSNRCGEVEAELRAREDDVRHLKEELDRAEFFNQTLSRELAAVRGVPGPLGVLEKPSEPYPVRSLRLGRGTAGRPAENGCAGDDALQVQVEPLDCENQALKAPGHLVLEVFEVTREGLKRPLSLWEVPPVELRRKWQSGLFTTGYVLTLPWKVPPSTEKLRVVARFQLVDGRLFEADKDITVRLLPEDVRRQLMLTTPPPSPSPAPAVPAPGPGQVPAPEKKLPGPYEVLPGMPKEVTPPAKPAEKTPLPAPPPGSGPILLRGQGSPRPSVRLLRPVPMPPE